MDSAVQGQFGALGVLGFALLMAGAFIILSVLVLIFVLLLRTKARNEALHQAAVRTRSSPSSWSNKLRSIDREHQRGTRPLLPW